MNESVVDGIIEDKTCNCKKSECLKLYCECFSNGVYCSSGKIRCNCNSCHNLPQYEKKRKAAINATLERNPYAFRQKGTQNNVDNAAMRTQGQYAKGCHCLRSHCLKKYCECFQAGIPCSSDKCRCQDCKNYFGSDFSNDTSAINNGEYSNNYISYNNNNNNDNNNDDQVNDDQVDENCNRIIDFPLIQLEAMLTKDNISKICESMLNSIVNYNSNEDIKEEYSSNKDGNTTTATTTNNYYYRDVDENKKIKKIKINSDNDIDKCITSEIDSELFNTVYKSFNDSIINMIDLTTSSITNSNDNNENINSIFNW